MCARHRGQKNAPGLLQNRSREVFGEIYRKNKRVRWALEREEINPARLVVMIRSLDLVIRMRFGTMCIPKVRMNQ